MARPRQARSVRPERLTRLFVARRRCGLTLADVRALTSIPIETISRAERGLSTPSDADLQTLARLFNEDVATLLHDISAAVTR